MKSYKKLLNLLALLFAFNIVAQDSGDLDNDLDNTVDNAGQADTKDLVRKVNQADLKNNNVDNADENPIKKLNKPILLKSPVLKVVDGIPGLMDGASVHKIIYMGQEIDKVQLGNVNAKTKKRVPQHKFSGKLYTLKELVKIESKNSKNNKTELNKLLIKLKNDFIKLTRPFLVDARGTKQQMLMLIKESCSKRGRHNSLLLDWTSDNEEKSFNKNVNSLKTLDIFCTDLVNFFKDLLYSCPKALKQFKEWEKNQKK